MSGLESQVNDLGGREDALRDLMFARLGIHFSAMSDTSESRADERLAWTLFERGFLLEKEACLNYATEASGVLSLSHKSDLLLSVFSKKMRLCPVLNVEIKYRSCVSDAFKARAYDQMHLRRCYSSLLGLLVFVKPRTGGISIRRARLISYPFDRFWTINEGDLSKESAWDALFDIFENRMKDVAADPQIDSLPIQAIE